MSATASSGLRLVCFDLGGVVIRICRTWAEGCAAAGLPVRDPDLWRSTGPARRDLVHEHQTGRIDASTFAARSSAMVDGLYSPAEILGVHQAWLISEYEGVSDLIDRLHAAGLETAALSNTNHEHWARMGEFPAVLRMRHLLASHRLGLRKPDHEIFQRVEQLTGCAGEQVIFFDDTADNVDAARQVGWRAETIDPAASPAEQITEALRAHGVPVGLP